MPCEVHQERVLGLIGRAAYRVEQVMGGTGFSHDRAVPGGQFPREWARQDRRKIPEIVHHGRQGLKLRVGADARKNGP
nr:hypothetical protein StreXyl84_08660 [Streptomyces sp. Xyl84]